MQLVHAMAKTGRTLQTLGVPADVLARNLESGVFAIKSVEIIQVLTQDAVNFSHLRRWQRGARIQKVFDLAKQPGTSLRGTPDHDAIGAGREQHLLGFLWRGDVAIGNHRNADLRFDHGDGLVFGVAHILVGTGTTVNRDGTDAAVFGDAGDIRCILVLAIPAGAEFQCNRSVGYGVYHCSKNLCHQGFVLHQR